MRLTIFILLLLLNITGVAQTIGQAATDLTGAVHIFNKFFTSLFYVSGISLFTASIIYFREYRQNPQNTPLSRVLWLLFGGIIIGGFPWFTAALSAYFNNFALVH